MRWLLVMTLVALMRCAGRTLLTASPTLTPSHDPTDLPTV